MGRPALPQRLKRADRKELLFKSDEIKLIERAVSLRRRAKLPDCESFSRYVVEAALNRARRDVSALDPD